MKRLFDLFLSIILIIPILLLISIIGIMIKISSKGTIFYWSERIGKNNTIFNMPKFRSMIIDTPLVASHLLINPNEYLSSIGKFLRRYSLDELPQFYSVLKGDMSIIGPRPALPDQEDLIDLRNKKGISSQLPGITGWAQINGRDGLSINDKVKLEEEYLKRQSFWFDLKILYKTFFKVFLRDGVSH